MSLLKLIREDADARRIFGKKELIIIEKQLLGISLSQSEKNRLSRDIRKKLEFIRKVYQFSEEFPLKKGQHIKMLIDETKEIILNHPFHKRIEKIILYGSFAENKFTYDSDIDISVKFLEISLKEATQFRIKVSGRSHENVDIQVYNHLPKKIRDQIDRKGRVLYNQKDKRENNRDRNIWE